MANLKFYLPDHLRDVCEMQAIADSETPEFALLRQRQRQMLEDQFILSASESALKRYEKMLGIPTATGDSIENRRFKILAKLNNQLPYSMGWLRKKLDTLLGEGNYQISCNTDDFKLTIEADVQFEKDIVPLYGDLRQSIPANMQLETYIASSHALRQYAVCWMQTYDEIYI